MIDNYKSLRSIDGKPKWVVVDETGKIVNRNPSKDELKGLEDEAHNTKHIKYNETNSCSRCGISFEKIGWSHPVREYDENDTRTGKWLCNICKGKDYRNMPDSHNNIMKSLANRRTGNQDPNHSNTKGDRFQELTCRWRSTISTIPVKDLNIELDNYKSPIDHSRDSELGVIDTTGRFYNPIHRWWHFTKLDKYNNEEIKIDYIICYCANKDGTLIERIYILPLLELTRTCISIYKNPMNTRGTKSIVPWYEQYRITDEDELKKINKIWKEIIKEV